MAGMGHLDLDETHPGLDDNLHYLQVRDFLDFRHDIFHKKLKIYAGFPYLPPSLTKRTGWDFKSAQLVPVRGTNNYLGEKYILKTHSDKKI